MSKFTKERRQMMRELLRTNWPHLFTFPVPLKIGIHVDILASGLIESRALLRRVLQGWVRSPEYLAALDKAKCRYGLDGSMCALRRDEA